MTDVLSRTADVRVDELTQSRCLVAPRWDSPKWTLPPAAPLVLPPGTTPCPFCPDADGVGIQGDLVEETSRRGQTGWSALSILNRWPLTEDPRAHEVVVLSRRHAGHLGNLPLAEAAVAIELLIEREAQQRSGGRHPTMFVNHGLLAGASQPHSHGQVMGLTTPEGTAVKEMPALQGDGCVLCRPAGIDRLVASGEGCRVLTATAPRSTYDQLVVLDRHAGVADPVAMAWGVGTAVRALFAVTGPVAYNLLFHLAGHSHVHVVPRLSGHSGLDFAGLHLSLSPLEEVAATLRSAAASLRSCDWEWPLVEAA